jgi:hypothetical protein
LIVTIGIVDVSSFLLEFFWNNCIQCSQPTVIVHVVIAGWCQVDGDHILDVCFGVCDIHTLITWGWSSKNCYEFLYYANIGLLFWTYKQMNFSIMTLCDNQCKNGMSCHFWQSWFLMGVELCSCFTNMCMCVECNKKNSQIIVSLSFINNC